MDPKIKIKILQKDDQVLNVFNINENINIAVKHKDGSVDIYQLLIDEFNLPRINSRWSITKGEGEIEIQGDNDFKVTTF